MSRNETLLFLNVAHFFDHLFLLIFPTAVIAVSAEWGMTYGAALALGTPIYVMFGPGTLPAGWLGDRYDRTLLIAVFFVGYGISSLLVSASNGPMSMMIGLGLIGLFATLYHPIGLALVTDVAQRTGRGGTGHGLSCPAWRLADRFSVARRGLADRWLCTPGAASETWRTADQSGDQFTGCQ